MGTWYMIETVVPTSRRKDVLYLARRYSEIDLSNLKLKYSSLDQFLSLATILFLSTSLEKNSSKQSSKLCPTVWNLHQAGVLPPHSHETAHHVIIPLHDEVKGSVFCYLVWPVSSGMSQADLLHKQFLPWLPGL